MVIEKEGKRISWVDEAVGLKTSLNICFAFYKIQKFLDCRGIWTVWYAHTCAPGTWVCQNHQGWGKENRSPYVFYLALHAVGLPSLPRKRHYISINVRQDRPRAGTARVSRPRTVIRSEGFSFLKNWNLTWNTLFLDTDVSGIFLFF